MSAFTHGFNHGFFHGMLNNMFGGWNMSMFWNPAPMFWNPSPMFFTPNYMQGSFVQYSTPLMNMPSVWSANVPDFSSATPNWASGQTFDYNVPNFSDSFNWGGTFVLNTSSKSKIEKKPILSRTDGDFDKMLTFVLSVEGGYTADDCGQAGNKGVRQATYDTYRTQKGLPKRNVKNITDDEVKDLYYTMFYKASGADKIQDARLALYVFDTAVNMGVAAAKKLLNECGNDADKFKNLRITKYESIAAANPQKARYLKSWKNRVAKAENYANREFAA